MFELEAIHAGKGDALIVRWGTKADPGTMLIDGGEDGPYPDHLRVRLQQLAAPGKTLDVPLAVISHVDADHIAGVIRLLTDIEKADARPAARPVEIGELWHNGFHDLELVEDLPAELRAAVRRAAKPQSLDLVPDGEGSRAVVESYTQGRTVVQKADDLGIARNAAFDDGFVRESGTLELHDLRLDVICPDDALLDQLAEEWAKELAKLLKKKPGLAPASVEVSALGGALDDPSVPNQSSIVLLATFRRKTMLLTGDARGDHVLAALRRRGLATEAKPLEVTLLKVAHHASAHSNSAELFACIKADHYVVSGDGDHGNPHPEIIKLLIAECLNRDATLYLTNYPDPALAPKRFKPEARKSKALLDAAVEDTALKLVFRQPGELGVTVPI